MNVSIVIGEVAALAFPDNVGQMTKRMHVGHLIQVHSVFERQAFFAEYLVCDLLQRSVKCLKHSMRTFMISIEVASHADRKLRQR